MPKSMLITREVTSSITKRADFYDRFPEFRAIKGIPEKKKGCSGCGKSRHVTNVYNLFRQILSRFDQAAAERFKRYVGADLVQFIGYNSKTRRTETITL